MLCCCFFSCLVSTETLCVIQWSRIKWVSILSSALTRVYIIFNFNFIKLFHFHSMHLYTMQNSHDFAQYTTQCNVTPIHKQTECTTHTNEIPCQPHRVRYSVSIPAESRWIQLVSYVCLSSLYDKKQTLLAFTLYLFLQNAIEIFDTNQIKYCHF